MDDYLKVNEKYKSIFDDTNFTLEHFDLALVTSEISSPSTHEEIGKIQTHTLNENDDNVCSTLSTAALIPDHNSDKRFDFVNNKSLLSRFKKVMPKLNWSVEENCNLSLDESEEFINKHDVDVNRITAPSFTIFPETKNYRNYKMINKDYYSKLKSKMKIFDNEVKLQNFKTGKIIESRLYSLKDHIKEAINTGKYDFDSPQKFNLLVKSFNEIDKIETAPKNYKYVTRSEIPKSGFVEKMKNYFDSTTKNNKIPHEIVKYLKIIGKEGHVEFNYLPESKYLGDRLDQRY